MRAVIAVSLSLLLLMLAPVVHACGRDMSAGPLGPGAQALQFQIISSFRLSSFQGALLSYQRMLNEELAIRIGIAVSNESDDIETTTVFADTLMSKHDSDVWDREFSAVLQWLTYKHKGDMSFYVGGGPKVNFSSWHDERIAYHLEDDGIAERQTEATAHGWGLGASGVAGVQWLVTASVALHAEYEISLLYEASQWTDERRYPSSPEYNYSTERDVSGWEFDSEGVRFGLSVYF